MFMGKPLQSYGESLAFGAANVSILLRLQLLCTENNVQWLKVPGRCTFIMLLSACSFTEVVLPQ